MKQAIARELQTATCRELDLLIRTSGEVRLSNFLLVAGGLCRAAVPRYAVAGLRRAAFAEALERIRRRAQRRFGGR